MVNRHWSLVSRLTVCLLCLSLGLSPAWAQHVDYCRTTEVLLTQLRKRGIILRSPVKRQTGRGYPHGTIGTGLLPISPLRGVNLRVCHVLVNFPLDADHLPVHTQAFYDDLLFNENNPDSMASYFKEISYGQVRITGKTFGWFNFGATPNNLLGVPRAAVAADIAAGGRALFIPQVIQQADPVVDFSQFDGDGDGRVDCLIVTFPMVNGYYGRVYGIPPVDPLAADPLSALAYRFSAAENRFFGNNVPSFTTNDAIVVDQWMVSGEGFTGLTTTGHNNGMAVYGHEFGHAIGLPDTKDETGGLAPRFPAGLGMWDGMGLGIMNDPQGYRFSFRPQQMGGLTHYAAWCKYAVGWVTPIPVTSKLTQVTIPASETNPVVYRMNVNGDPLQPEYFLLENRQNIGRFDSLLRGMITAAPAPGPAPGTGPSQKLAHGLLVYHVDESVIENSRAGVFIVTDLSHPGLKIMQADGRNDLDNCTFTGTLSHLFATFPWDILNLGFGGMLAGNFGDDSDTFPGTSRITEFTFTTTPSNQTYNGFDSGVRVTNVIEQRSNVVADLDVIPVFTPTLTIIEPTEGQRTANTTPTVRALYNNGSALGNAADPLLISTIDVVLDNNEVVSNGQVNPPGSGTFSFDGMNLVYRPVTPLTSGRHSVLIRGNDQAHATASPPFVTSALVGFTIQPVFIQGGTITMVSFPFRLTVTPGLQPNNAAQMATIQDLVKGGPQFVLQTPNPRLARFDLTRNAYHFFNPVPPPSGRPTDPFVDLLFPGCAYWVLLPSDGVAVRIEGEAIPSNQVFQMFHEDSAADGTMPPGFRMVGSPFDFPVDWANVQIGFQGQVFSLDQAINNNPPLVSPIIYTFIQQGGYRFDVAPEGQLLPFTGHWIRLLQPAQIFIPPSRGGLRSVANSKGERRKAKGEIQWRLQLAASVGDSVTSMSSDVYNYVGASSAAEDGEDRWDAPKAPTPPGSRVLLNIVRSPNGTAGNGTAGNGTESVPYAQDLRKGPFTKKQVFDLEVVADAPNVEVRLTWPNVQEVPKNYAVILRDLETQKQVYLRTSGGYTYNSGAGGARRLQIVVDPSGSKPLQVTVRAAKAQMGAGALFTYALSQEADVEAVVISPTGQLLRRFNARSAPVGVHTLSWDGKDSRGRALGRGVYLLRVRAQTPESQVSQGVATFMMR